MRSVSKFDPIGRCIYCGEAGELSDEHIIPYALGWHTKLPQASCLKHREMTHAFEGRCSGTLYKAVRVHNSIQSRRPQPKELPITFVYGDRKTAGSISLDGHLGIFPVIHFPPPGVLRNPPDTNATWVGTKLSALPISPKNSSKWNEHGTDTVQQSMEFDMNSLGRMLAKIAYVAAVGQFGYKRFDSWILPLIEGRSKESMPYLVGSHEKIEPVVESLHQLGGRIVGKDGRYLIVYDIRLFACIAETATYQVVVGEVSAGRFDELQAS